MGARTIDYEHGFLPVRQPFPTLGTMGVFPPRQHCKDYYPGERIQYDVTRENTLIRQPVKSWLKTRTQGQLHQAVLGKCQQEKQNMGMETMF